MVVSVCSGASYPFQIGDAVSNGSVWNDQAHSGGTYCMLCSAYTQWYEWLIDGSQGTDDLGTKGDSGSLSTGNSGGRAACGIVGAY